MDKEINFKSEGESRYWFDQEFKFCFQRFTEKQTALLFFLQPRELFRPLPPLFEQEKIKMDESLWEYWILPMLKLEKSRLTKGN